MSNGSNAGAVGSLSGMISASIVQVDVMERRSCRCRCREVSHGLAPALNPTEMRCSVPDCGRLKISFILESNVTSRWFLHGGE